MNETEEILQRAATGDKIAFEELFDRHRPRLLKIIALRMDRRIAGRVDPSDILQETYMEAFKRLPKYLKKPDMEFYNLLRWIAREKTIEFYRRHVGTRKRTIRNEVPLTPVDSSAKLVSGLIGRLPTPSQELAKAELAEMLQKAFRQLDSDEQDLILWRHFDQLSTREMAELLNITEAAAFKRYMRAVQRLRKILQDLGAEKLR
ncbi:MAG: sigma-70 family RNA polymerase sigma factor [Acidobacteriota bacterium]